jgi:hypothetical protein
VKLVKAWLFEKAVWPCGLSFPNTVPELRHDHNDDMLQRKAAQLTAYGLKVSLLCALYMKLRRQVGDGGWKRGDGFVK